MTQDRVHPRKQRQTHAAPARSGLFPAITALCVVLVIGLFLQTFVLQTYRIPSASMENTLQIGDFVLVSKTGVGVDAGRSLWGRLQSRLLPPAKLRRGDLAVFHFPPDPSRLLVKRVVALPGEHLRLHEGRVYVDGKPLAEPYALYTPSQPEVFRDEFPNLREADPGVDPRWWRTLRRLQVNGEITVPPGQYFVLGDNRNNSEDSRYWGFVPQVLVIGRPVLVYFSVPNVVNVPGGGPLERLRWLFGWIGQRAGILH